MARAQKTSKKSRRKTAALGAAGASLVFTGGAAVAAPMVDPPSHNTPLSPSIVLGEEEISDVSLGTFYVFDRQDRGFLGVQLAQRGCRGCGGGGRCGGGAGRCGGGGCAVARCGGGGRCAVARCGGRCGAGCAVVRRCGVGVVGCAGCGCTCSGCTAPCWVATPVGWTYVCPF